MTAEQFTPSVTSTEVSIRAVVFDLDGLMVDSESLFFRTAVQLLGRRGKQFTHDLMCRMLGLRGPEGIEVMKREHALDESSESLAAEAREIFYELMPTELRTMPGLATLLDCVEQADLPKAVATSSTRAYTERVLDQFALRPRFEFLLTAADVTHGKPDPEIYRLAASRHRVAPAEVLVLEDSPVGLAAAKAAGAFCVVIPSAYTPHADWSAADVIADRLDAADLLRLIAPANR